MSKQQADRTAYKGRYWRCFSLLGRPMLRRIASQPLLALTYVLVILITAASVSAIPMILNRVGDDGLLESMQNALVIQRGITVTYEGRLNAPEGDALGPLDERGNRYRDGLTTPIRDLIDNMEWVTDSARHDHLNPDLTTAFGPVDRFFQFRYQSRLDEHTELIAGRLPEPTESIRLSEFAELNDPEADTTVPRFEVMIGDETAEIMDLGIGNIFAIQATRADPLNRNAPREYMQQIIAVEVVGIFRANDPDADFWYYDRRTFRTDVFASPEQTIYYTMAVPSPEVLNDLLALNDPGRWRYSWRYFVEPDAVDIAGAPGVATELQTLVQNRGPYQEIDELRPTDAARQVTIRTMLASLLLGAERQYRLTSAVLSLVIAGLLTIGVSIAGLLGALIASRRAQEIALMRSRGGSPTQLSMMQFGESLLLGIPAALSGLLIALVLTGRGLTSGAILAAGIVTVTGALALWFLIRRIWMVDLGQLLGRQTEVPGGRDQRRIVVEALIITLAIAGIILLRQRGVTTGAAQQGFDPYIAAVPVLTGLATGILTIRIFPVLMRFAAAIASRRTDIVPFLGLRRIAEPSLGRHLPLVVMVLALGMAVFAGSIWYAVETPEAIPIEELEVDPGGFARPAPAGVNDAFRDGINLGFWLTMIMAGIYAVIAVVSALALTANARQRDIGYLRTLGASQSETLKLTIMEQMPAILLSGIIGLGLGAVVTWLIAPGLDIASLFPGDQIVTIQVNWFLAIGQAVVFLITVIVSVLIFGILARRADLHQILRIGE